MIMIINVNCILVKLLFLVKIIISERNLLGLSILKSKMYFLNKALYVLGTLHFNPTRKGYK